MAQQTSNWRTVQIPVVLIEKIEIALKRKNSTFKTKSDFITYAIRKELEAILNV